MSNKVFQQTDTQFSRGSEGLFQNSKLSVAPNPLQIFTHFGVLLQITEKLHNLLRRQVHTGAVIFDDLEGLWSDGQFAVLKKALTAAAELGVGLLEATEEVEPNPIRPNESTSYSNLYHCDREGVYLYMDTVSRQIEDAIRKSEE